MERKFQSLLEKILRQIFIKKIENSAGTALESQPSALPVKQGSPVVVAFLLSGPAIQPRSPEYYRSAEYFARLRHKMRVCFKQEKDVILASEPGESFEKKLRINEVENFLEEVVLLEYLDQPLSKKITRVEELQEIYRKMVKNRQSGY